MVQDTLVNFELTGGWRLIGKLIERGLPVTVAFWAYLEEKEKWILYLASPVVDEKGTTVVNSVINDVTRDDPELGFRAFRVTALGAEDLMAKEALETLKPIVVAGAPAPKPYRKLRRFERSSLGRRACSGAFIYPPWEPGIDPVN